MEMNQSAWVIGIDTGGTFTDLAAVNVATGTKHVTKVPSTPGNPAEGILGALRTFSLECGAHLGQITFLAHGTTVATNAVLEGRGARAGLLINRGFHAIYEMRAGTRPGQVDLVDPRYQKPRSLIPLSLTRGVSGRVAYDGAIIEPLDEDDVRQAVESLREEGVESIAVVCLFSFMNPSQEERIGAIIREAYPGCRVSLSSQVLPVIREYPRLSTTALDAYVGPVVERYFQDLQLRARREGLNTQQFYVMQSNGGLMRIVLAVHYPNETLLSGPAAGVVFGTRLGEQTGDENLVTLDMGGTSTDMSVIRRGGFSLTREGKIAGQEIGTPMIEIETLGAGGGAIAWIAKDGLMKVGPQSAGAAPGPACYGKGGQEPTVTDANVALGYLDAGRFLGGRMQGSAELAREALARVGRGLGLDAIETAIGVNRIVNTHIAGGLRLTLTDKGCDPSRFTLVAFGGSGPVHAWRVAEDVGIPRIIIPPHPGIGCAIGLLQTDVIHVYMQSYLVDLGTALLGEINERFVSLEKRAYEDASVEGFPREDVRLVRQLDLRYPHQSYELSVDCPLHELTEEDRALIRAAFDAQHEQVYGISGPDEKVEVVNVRVRSVVPQRHTTAMQTEKQPDAGEGGPRGRRMAYFEALGGFAEAMVYDRALLSPGNRVPGPAIVEQLDSTTVIGPAWLGRVDTFGNIIIEKKSGEGA
ncbi:MAG: hydantoinase/oxoprolinase family protein [Chloroflexi bacterium]|nr:hydantoinase/oxoprolinase family protein [Chloroflexota bacterium]